ncbi:MAG TPA: hypothetical protein VF085_01175 [Solirubrobacterales bacterium]
MRLPLAAAIAAALIVALLGASPTSAAREAGDGCVADAVEANRTTIPRDSGPTMSRTVPGPTIGESEARVVTGWKVRVDPGQASLPQRLEIYRALDVYEYRQEAQTPLETVHEGENFFPARIPVWTGASLGLYGPEGTLACSTEESTATATFEGGANVGEVKKVTELSGFRTPVTVAIESDEDGDGYGDETQDGCTEYAAIHTACPFVHLTPSVTAVTKRAIVLDVSTGDPTQVQVNGQVGWGLRSKSGTRAKHGKRPLIVALTGGAQEVPAAATVTFTVTLPKAVKRRLARLSSKEKLKAHLTVIATDLVGHRTVQHLTVWLPGPEIVVSKR